WAVTRSVTSCASGEKAVSRPIRWVVAAPNPWRAPGAPGGHVEPSSRGASSTTVRGAERHRVNQLTTSSYGAEAGVMRGKICDASRVMGQHEARLTHAGQAPGNRPAEGSTVKVDRIWWRE